MPILVLQICNTDSFHYHLTHLSSRLTSFTFSRCSFMAPPTSQSFHLCPADCTSLLPPGFQVLQLVHFCWVELFSLYALAAGDLTKPWDHLINLSLALDKLSLCAKQGALWGAPMPAGFVPSCPQARHLWLTSRPQWWWWGCSAKYLVCFRRTNI